MTEVLQTNIFLFITTAAILAFTIFLCVAIFYVIIILRTISKIVERINESSENIASDVVRLKSYVTEGRLMSKIVGLFAGSGRFKKRRQQNDE